MTFSAVPRNVDPFANLLTILILPTVIFGRADDDATNLLTLADGTLEFTQTLRGDRIAAQSVGAIRKTGDGQLHWQSEAHGDIQIPEIASVEPFDAVMLPHGHGKLTDVFVLPFVHRQGRELVHVVRQITFTPRAEIAKMQFRRVSIQSTVRDRTVEVRTTSVIRTVTSRFRIE